MPECGWCMQEIGSLDATVVGYGGRLMHTECFYESRSEAELEQREDMETGADRCPPRE